MSLQVIAPKVSVYEITGADETGQPTAVERIYQRGDLLPDWVDGHQAFVLVSVGMAAEVGDHPDERIRPVGQESAPVVQPYMNPASVVGSGVKGPIVVTETMEGSEISKRTKSGPSDSLAPLPSDGEPKAVWEDYAVQKLPGEHSMTRPQVEAMRKAELVSEVKSRRAAAVEDDEEEPDLPPAYTSA